MCAVRKTDVAFQTAQKKSRKKRRRIVQKTEKRWPGRISAPTTPYNRFTTAMVGHWALIRNLDRKTTQTVLLVGPIQTSNTTFGPYMKAITVQGQMMDVWSPGQIIKIGPKMTPATVE